LRISSRKLIAVREAITGTKTIVARQVITIELLKDSYFIVTYYFQHLHLNFLKSHPKHTEVQILTVGLDPLPLLLLHLDLHHLIHSHTINFGVIASTFVTGRSPLAHLIILHNHLYFLVG